MQYLAAISKKVQNDLGYFQGKPFSITATQVYAPATNAKESEVECLYENLQDLL